jgi:uncharacterized protein
LTSIFFVMTASAQAGNIIIWKGIRPNTTEYCSIKQEPNGIVVRGQITGLLEDRPINIYYAINLDKDYQINAVHLQCPFNNSFDVSLLHKDEKWYDLQGNHLSQYDDCDDVDISITPFTNTIPIRRLHLTLGESRKIPVIYIDPLENTLTRTLQRYTYMENSRYRYENLTSGFVSEVITDSTGIVVEYPGIWKMIYPLSAHPFSKSDNVTPPDFAGALISPKKWKTIDVIQDIYAALLGNWKLKMTDYNPEKGTEKYQTGLWYFSRILEGRAIQDVLVSPEFAERYESSLPGNRYGTTLRTMDPVTHQWKVYWFNPVSGTHNQLAARKDGDRIIQETPETDGLKMRWIFENITADSFHWYGENSLDHGKTWLLSAEFFATRIN